MLDELFSFFFDFVITEALLPDLETIDKIDTFLETLDPMELL